MSFQIVSECRCHDCGNPMDVQPQDDGKNGYYLLVTCFNPLCELRYVTRSLVSYNRLTECEFESYRAMNRQRAAEVAS